MRKFKNWLYDSFLPGWAKETVLAENKQLNAENFRLKTKVVELQSYIDGLETGIRKQRKIIINTNEVVK